MQSILSLGQLATLLKQVVEGQPEFQNLWVNGEISNLTIARSGHAYFTLKDAESQFRCVMWRNAVQRQRLPMREGDQVIAHGAVTVYAPRGEVQLQVDLVQPQGTGLLQMQMEELRMRLEAEGLFDESRKRSLPALPGVIGVVTSAEGAVWHDIQRVVSRRYPLTQLVLSPSLVQGDLAPMALVNALQRLQNEAQPDVIIIGRGGGSMEDLWAFNDERVVRAIYASKVPIIAAIGHESDITLSDYVADVSAGTPSMAAELATPDLVQIDAALVETKRALAADMLRMLDRKLERLDDLQRQLTRLSPQARLESLHRELDGMRDRARLAMQHRLAAAQREIVALEGLMESINPQAVLNRGYAFVVNDSTGAPIRSIGDAMVGDPIRATLADGSILATVGTTIPSSADR
ncbi:MAG: exodeoxyribonuclease VII large subunit [Thermomicrobiales bacterium]|nr:exodeoxyribonuclease VII large subunit [Thermomicrobiales bacterium]